MTPVAPRAASTTISEKVFQTLTRSAGIGILVLVATLVGVLFWDGWPALSRAGSFQIFTSRTWAPTPADGSTPVFGSLAFIWGTAVTSILAMLIAVPLGVASAAFMSEIAPPWLRRIGAFLIELLAAIPSVVYGFWGLFFLAPVIQHVFDAVGGPNTGGNGIIAAGVILAIMILPYITAISYDVCQAVPRSQREGSLALGATRWQTIWRVVLPYARPGIVAASFLALGRALGETMAVTMLIGNQPEIHLSPFALGDSIASKIANSLNEANTKDFRSSLVALALVLFVLTAVFNILARLLLAGLTRTRKAPPPAAVPPTNDLVERERAIDAIQRPEPRRSHAVLWNRVMTGVMACCLGATVVPLFLILGYIMVRGASSVSSNLFTQEARQALTNEQYEQYKKWEHTGRDEDYPRKATGRPALRGGLGHAMLGSLMLVGMATLFAVPSGLMAAIYLAEARRSRVANVIRFVTELLGGVPSIVIGIFAYACFVYPFWLGGVPWGFNGWAGAFALAVMMIPIIVRNAEESMKLVPESIRQASYALGASRMQTTLRIVLPAALPAIVTGIFLAIGRIAGETAPLILTAGQYDYWPQSPGQQTPFLTGYIYAYATSPDEDFRDQAWGAALVLLAVVMLLNIGIRLLAGKRVVAASRAD